MKRWILNIILRLLHIYWCIFKPVTLGVRAIVIDEKDAILLVRHTYQDYKNWYLPGGGVKKGETFEQAIRRELFEEIRYEVNIIELFGVYNNTSQGKRDNIVVFICRNGKFIDTADKSKSFEIKKYEFFSYDNLPENISKGTRKRIEEFFGSDMSKHFGMW